MLRLALLLLASLALAAKDGAQIAPLEDTELPGPSSRSRASSTASSNETGRRLNEAFYPFLDIVGDCHVKTYSSYPGGLCIVNNRRRRRVRYSADDSCTAQFANGTGPLHFLYWSLNLPEDVVIINGQEIGAVPPEGDRPFGEFSWKADAYSGGGFSVCVPAGPGSDAVTQPVEVRLVPDALTFTEPGQVFQYWSNDTTQRIAQLACEASLGQRNCILGQCGGFRYYFRAGSLSCNCGKGVGEYEWIFENRAHEYVGQDYSWQAAGTWVGSATLFLRQRLALGCGPESWGLVTARLGSVRAASHHLQLDFRAINYVPNSGSLANLVEDSGVSHADVAQINENTDAMQYESDENAFIFEHEQQAGYATPEQVLHVPFPVNDLDEVTMAAWVKLPGVSQHRKVWVMSGSYSGILEFDLNSGRRLGETTPSPILVPEEGTQPGSVLGSLGNWSLSSAYISGSAKARALSYFDGTPVGERGTGTPRAIALNDPDLGLTGITTGVTGSRTDNGLGRSPSGQWIHVVGVWRSKGISKAFLNGVAGAEAIDNRDWSGTEDLYIGSPHSSLWLSDAVVFDRALSDAEVHDLYLSGRPSKVNDVNRNCAPLRAFNLEAFNRLYQCTLITCDDANLAPFGTNCPLEVARRGCTAQLVLPGVTLPTGMSWPPVFNFCRSSCPNNLYREFVMSGTCRDWPYTILNPNMCQSQTLFNPTGLKFSEAEFAPEGCSYNGADQQLYVGSTGKLDCSFDQVCLCGRICRFADTSTTTTPPPSSWTVTSGPCWAAGDCVHSPHFPLTYQNSQSCTISGPAWPILIRTFSTEESYDVLVVNGVSYSGFTGPHRIIPQNPITWTSNENTTNRGWKLCSDTAVKQECVGNCAQGALVACSNETSSCGAAVVDGDRSCANATDSPHMSIGECNISLEVYLDLRAVLGLSEVRLFSCAGESYCQTQVEVSVDGASWDVVHKEPGYSEELAGGTRVEFQRQLARYVKVSRGRSSTDSVARILEVEVYGPLCEDNATWTDHLYGDGSWSCADFSSRPSWCFRRGPYSSEVQKACPVSCGVCTSAFEKLASGEECTGDTRADASTSLASRTTSLGCYHFCLADPLCTHFKWNAGVSCQRYHGGCQVGSASSPSAEHGSYVIPLQGQVLEPPLLMSMEWKGRFVQQTQGGCAEHISSWELCREAATLLGLASTSVGPAVGAAHGCRIHDGKLAWIARTDSTRDVCTTVSSCVCKVTHAGGTPLQVFAKVESQDVRLSLVDLGGEDLSEPTKRFCTAVGDRCIGKYRSLTKMAGKLPLSLGDVFPHPVDWDGDGDLDILLVRETSLLYIENFDSKWDVTAAFGLPKEPALAGPCYPAWSSDVDPFCPHRCCYAKGTGDICFTDAGWFTCTEHNAWGITPSTSEKFSGVAAVDWDGDLDVDLILGSCGGFLEYFRRNGSTLERLTGEQNPFETVSVAGCAYPEVVDWDGDQDLDLLVGDGEGGIHYFENEHGVLVQRSGSINPFDRLEVDGHAVVSVGDWDRDGDLDVLVGVEDGTLAYFERVQHGGLVKRSAEGSPFDGIQVNGRMRSRMVDLDGDGLLDLLYSEPGGAVRVWRTDEQGGIADRITERFGRSNPFEGLSVGYGNMPQAIDWNADGKSDLLVGQLAGKAGTEERKEIRYIRTESDGTLFPDSSFNLSLGVVPAFHAADYDDDGVPELLVVDATGEMNLHWQEPSGLLGEPVALTLVPPPGGGASQSLVPYAVDWDSDGDLDLVIGDSGDVAARRIALVDFMQDEWNTEYVEERSDPTHPTLINGREIYVSLSGLLYLFYCKTELRWFLAFIETLAANMEGECDAFVRLPAGRDVLDRSLIGMPVWEVYGSYASNATELPQGVRAVEVVSDGISNPYCEVCIAQGECGCEISSEMWRFCGKELCNIKGFDTGIASELFPFPESECECIDQDAGAKDQYGAGCSEYEPRWCVGGHYDDADFQSTMCCVCGGGLRGDGSNVVWKVVANCFNIQTWIPSAGGVVSSISPEPAPNGTIRYYEQVSNLTFVEKAGSESPFHNIAFTGRPFPCVVDWDSDGNLDLVVGVASPDVMLVTSDGTQTRPYCASHAGCTNKLDLEAACARGVCRAAGFHSGRVYEGFSDSSDLCTLSAGARASTEYDFYVDTDTVELGTPSGYASITALCLHGGFVRFFEGHGANVTEWEGQKNPLEPITAEQFVAIQVFDWDEDAEFEALVGDSSNALRYVKIGSACELGEPCNFKGMCHPVLGTCFCLTGYSLGDCSRCSKDWYTVRGRAAKVDSCLACPGVDSIEGPCTGRGICNDDDFARSYGRDIGSNSTADLYVGTGNCVCSQYYSGEDNLKRVDCSEGECPVGHHPTTGANGIFCQNCSAGFYKESAGNFACFSCLPGRFSRNGMSMCFNCSAGQYQSETEAVNCDLCPLGEYSGNSSSSCTPCQAGTVANVQQSGCVDCQPGYFSSRAGEQSCEECHEGFYAKEGSTTCTPCEAGQYAPQRRSSECLDCAIGHYSAGGSRCEPCLAGRFLTDGACSDCLAGRFSAVEASTDCTPCNAGYFNSRLQEETCEECQAGFYSGMESTECTPCEAGRYSAQTKSTECLSCSAGQYSVGGSSCQPCAAGRFLTAGGACSDCDAGRFADTEASTECTPCDPGRYNSGIGSSTANDCIACFVGTYSTQYGGTEAGDCDACPSGTTTRRPGSTNASACIQPDPNQNWTCTAGQDCWVHITGRGLFDDHSMAIVSSDGSQLLERADLSVAAGTLHKWVNLVLDGSDTYRIKWCPGIHIPCTSLARFGFEVGILTVRGPLREDWTCIRGRHCSVGPVRGQMLSSEDTIQVHETCGSGALTLTSSNPSGQGENVTLVSNGSLTFNFGDEVLSVAPSTSYQLCWCAAGGSCSDRAAFHAIAGSLTVEGPRGGHEVVCYLGQHCEVGVIQGTNLKSGDRVVVVEACGSPPILGVPGNGIAERDGSASGYHYFLPLDYGQRVLQSAPGIFRLCFCRPVDGSNCSNPADFLVGLGLFTAYGPYTDNDQACYVDSECTLSNFRGIGLAEGDGVQVMSNGTCTGAPPIMNAQLGLPTLPASATQSGKNYNLGRLLDDTVPGRYVMCWSPQSRVVDASFRSAPGHLYITCKAGFFRLASETSVYCELCTIGFYCKGGTASGVWVNDVKLACGTGRTTQEKGATTDSLCLCSKGLFLQASSGECESCPRGRFKTDISNEDVCAGMCPENSSSLPGASSHEHCYSILASDSNDSSQVIADVFVLTGKIGMKINCESSELGVVSAQLTATLAESLQLSLSDVLLSTAGCNSTGTVPEQGRLLQESTISSVIATYRIRRTSQIDVDRLILSINVDEIRESIQTKVGTSVPDFTIWEAVLPTVVTERLNCTDRGTGRAFVLGSRPTSLDECRCAAGYTLNELSVCVQCDVGLYKNFIGDGACISCPAAGSVRLTTATEGASFESDCECPAGYFDGRGGRPPRNCNPCGLGLYCLGGEQRVKCPTGTTTFGSLSKSYEDCICLAGYEPLVVTNETHRCSLCASTWYKVGVGNLDCTQQCRPNSASNLGATSQDDCFCNTGFYYMNATETCDPCPVSGINCPGGFEPGTRIHVAPRSKLGYYMTGFAMAERCEIQDAVQSVCLPDATVGNTTGACSGFQTGLLCGSCQLGSSRDLWDNPCLPCDQDTGEWFDIISINFDLFLKASFGIFLGKQAMDSAVKMKKMDAIVLRILLQWITTCSVLGSFDLSQVTLYQWSQDILKAEAVANSTTEPDVQNAASGLDFSFNFPPWFQGIWNRLMVLKGSIPSFKSARESIECMAVKHLEVSGRDPHQDPPFKVLLLPAVYWLVYPVLVIMWVALLSVILGKVVYPCVIRVEKRVQFKLEKLLLAAGCTPATASAASETLHHHKIIDVLEDPAVLTSVQGLTEFLGIDVMAEVVAAFLSQNAGEHILEMLGSLLSGDAVATALEDTIKAVLDGGIPKMFDFLVSILKNIDPAAIASVFTDPFSVMEAISQAIQGASPAAMFDGGAGMLETAGQDGYAETGAQLAAADAAGEDLRNRSRIFHETYTVFGLYRSTRCRQIVIDAIPLYFVTMYSIWDDVTRRMLGLIQMRRVLVATGSQAGFEQQEIQQRWLYDMRLQGFRGNHFPIGLIGIVGLGTWSLGFIGLLYVRLHRRRHHLQEPALLRAFGYFYNGLEPQVYWWDVVVKKIDVLLIYVVTFTEIFNDPRAKLIMYLGFAGIFWSLHNMYHPFDDRQNQLADRLEGLGLSTRFVTLFMLQLLLMLDAPALVNATAACFLLFINGWFIVLTVFILLIEIPGGDGSASSEKTQDDAVDMGRAKLKTAMARMGGSDPIRKACLKCAGWTMGALIRPLIKQILKLGKRLSHKKETISKLVPCIQWTGSGGDLLVVEINPDEPLRWYERLFSKLITRVYKLGNDEQRSFIANVLGQFVDFMLTTAELNQVPGNIFDVFFTLPEAMAAVKAKAETELMLDPYHILVGRMVRLSCVTYGKETVQGNSVHSDMKRRHSLTSNEIARFTVTGEDLNSALLFIQHLKASEVEEFLHEACYSASDDVGAADMVERSKTTIRIVPRSEFRSPELSRRHEEDSRLGSPGGRSSAGTLTSLKTGRPDS